MRLLSRLSRPFYKIHMDKQNTSSARVADYLHAVAASRCNNVSTPAFSLILDPNSDNKYRNYAIPVAGVEPSKSDVRALVETFVSHGRTPRLEYIASQCPSLLAILQELGFKEENTLPLMACEHSTLKVKPTPAGVECRLVTTGHGLIEAASIQNAAYGAGAANDADRARLAKLVETGGVVAVAYLEDEAVGSGLFGTPINATCEIAAIGVLAKARRRGIGSMLTFFLTREAFDRGVCFPFLMAADAAEARMYRAMGFEEFATMIHISM